MEKRKLIIITLVILVLAILSGHGNSLHYSQRHSNLLTQKMKKQDEEIGTEETTNRKESSVVVMSDGYQLEITLPEQIGVSDEDIALGDSHVQVGDTNGVEEYFSGIGVNPDNICSCTVDNKDIYLGEKMAEDSVHHVYILQDIGAKNYLKVEVLDEKNTLTIENITRIIALSANYS